MHKLKSTISLPMKVMNIFLIITSLLVGCNPPQQKGKDSVRQLANTRVDTLHIDTAALMETFQQEDTAYNEYLADRLKPIRENFKRINAISKWTSNEKTALEESTEGGEATFCYSTGVLEKIVTRHFGETFQQLTEYFYDEFMLHHSKKIL